MQITSTQSPSWAFQNNSFLLNATIKASINASNNTLATLDTYSAWVVSPSRIINLGNISAGNSETAGWTITPTSSGSNIQLNISANNTNGLNASTTATISVYKWRVNSTPAKAELYDTSGNLGCLDNICNVLSRVSDLNVTVGNSLDSQDVEAELTSGRTPKEYLLAYWTREAGDYYYSNLTIYLEGNASSSNAVVYAYNGSAYNKIYKNQLMTLRKKLMLKY